MKSSWYRPSQRLTGFYNWLAVHAAKRWISLILVVCILPVDLLHWEGWSFGVRALLDEPCHQATGLICLGAITRFRGRPPDPRFGWAMLICSNAIDLDHLPLEFGSSVLTAGTPRPYTHALWVVLLLALAALAVRCSPRLIRRTPSRPMACVLFGAACGVSDHFLRDIATAQMSLWWPISDAPVEVAYWWYVAAIVVIALVPVSAVRKRAQQGLAEELVQVES